MLRPAATSATEPRQLVVDNLRQTVTSGSALASYLSTIYHQPLNSIQLAKVRLDQLQWMWNFAPISVECLYVRTSFSWQPSQVAPASSVCLQRGAQAGAVRVAPSYSLKLLDVYGYGLPFAMSSCPGAATINSHSRGAGATVEEDAIFEVTRLSTSLFIRGGGKNGTRLDVEGGPRGCWFVALRGTGIFLRAGRTLHVHNRSELVAALRLNRSTVNEAVLNSGQNPFNGKAFRNEYVTKLLSEGFARVGVTRSIEDYLPICTHLRAAGFESAALGVEIKEIVNCGDACVRTHLDGSCVPSVLRTGWNASLPCMCNNSIPVLNCQPFPNLSTLKGRGLPLHLGQKARKSEGKTRGFRSNPGYLEKGLVVRRCEV